MKLATLCDGTRDGRLAVVSGDLRWACWAPDMPTMQFALDDWRRAGPLLQAASRNLEDPDPATVFDFDPADAAAILPRAFQWLDASAFLHHGELMQKAFALNKKPDEGMPLMYQGASDHMTGARAPIYVHDDDLQIDFESEVAVVVDDVPMGCDTARAGEHIQLLLLLNDVSLRKYAAREMESGFGWIQAKPTTSFAPVAVSPDELGQAWDGGRLHLPVVTHMNGQWFGSPNAGEMDFSFGELIAFAARHRNLIAGTIIGSGTVSNRDRAAGSSCITERRALEILATGSPSTPFMRFGDRVRIEVLDRDGRSIFGAIDQCVAKAPEIGPHA